MVRLVLLDTTILRLPELLATQCQGQGQQVFTLAKMKLGQLKKDYKGGGIKRLID